MSKAISIEERLQALEANNKTEKGTLKVLNNVALHAGVMTDTYLYKQGKLVTLVMIIDFKTNINDAQTDIAVLPERF